MSLRQTASALLAVGRKVFGAVFRVALEAGGT
jgi:hypothetical protein